MNHSLLDAGIARIEENPEEWAQEAWRCRTGMCYAGHVVFAAGGTWAIPEELVSIDVQLRSLRGPVYGVAAAELGLDSGLYQDDALFYGNNTLEQLKAMVALLHENEQATYAELMAAAEHSDFMAEYQ